MIFRAGRAPLPPAPTAGRLGSRIVDHLDHVLGEVGLRVMSRRAGVPSRSNAKSLYLCTARASDPAGGQPSGALRSPEAYAATHEILHGRAAERMWKELPSRRELLKSVEDKRLSRSAHARALRYPFFGRLIYPNK